VNIWLDTNWYAVNTKPHREETAAMNIRRLGLEVLLPKIARHKSILSGRKIAMAHLFPSYLFAKFSPKEYLHSIRYARGVRRVVSAGETPLPVDETIISAIKSRIDETGFVALTAKQFAAGEQVVIQEGFLQGQTGIFERELTGQQRVVILLQSIEYQARVFVEKRFLSPVAEAF
jgi:transcriptional antiterminator RfaH